MTMGLQTPYLHGAGYRSDAAGFEAANGNRRLLLRCACGDEIEAPGEERFVLVTEVAPGLHVTATVWHGMPFFGEPKAFGYYVFDDDAAVAAVVDECARRDRGGRTQQSAAIR